MIRALLLFLLILAAPSLAQTTADGARHDGSDADGRQIVAARFEVGSPEIDGRLLDAAWREAQWVTRFTQKEPDQGAPATLATEVAFLYDDDALYVGARMSANEPGQIGDQLTRRDQGGNAERLIVSLDTFLDRRTAYSFAVTAAGVRVDWYHPVDLEFERDHTFDPVWTARTEVTSEGWTAEMRIPFSQLRFNPHAELVWGVNINRYIPSLNEDDFWIVVPRDETGWASKFGDLVGLRDLPSNRRIEILPYLASSATMKADALVDADDPFDDTLDRDLRTGLDVRMGIGPNLTLDATVNPDFGQVEADPAEVNLTAFETFFDERRPFFTEGQQNFDGNGPDYYYSRRIGARPHLSPVDDLDGIDFDDAPPTTTIVSAAKLTGRLPSGLTIGALAAWTDAEKARTFDLDAAARDELDVEPTTAYGAVRLQQQFGPNASTVGVTLTGVQRSIDESTPLADEVPEQAIAGGADWNRRFTDGWYELLGHVGFSHVAGTPEAIAALQENSVHYYQRPDQDHVDLDPSRESLSGWSAAFRGGKRTGDWRWTHGLWMDSPGFDINDAGRLGHADEINQWGNFSYRETDPGDVLRNWNVGVFTNNGWNFGRVRRYSNLGTFLNWTLLGFTNGFLEYGYEFGSQSDTQTRGGPLMRTASNWWLAGGASSNFNSPNGWGLRSMGWRDELGGWQYRIDPEARVQISDRLSLNVTPRWVRTRQARQYLDTLDGGSAPTFGSRYVFGFIDRSEIAAQLRANYSFGPDLNLELYAEPFASSGRYFGIGELVAPETNALRTYGEDGTTLERDDDGDLLVTDGAASFTLDNPDFDVLSFRSNLVLRWEWSPGSTLFVVWQQNRESDGDEGRLVGADELLDAFSADGENILAIKLSYWFPL